MTSEERKKAKRLKRAQKIAYRIEHPNKRKSRIDWLFLLYLTAIFGEIERKL